MSWAQIQTMQQEKKKHICNKKLGLIHFLVNSMQVV